MQALYYGLMGWNYRPFRILLNPHLPTCSTSQAQRPDEGRSDGG